MQKPFLFIAFIVLTFATSAQIYKGTIGSYPVYLQMEYFDGGEFNGAYFYESQVVTIPFNGTLTGKKLTMQAGSLFTSEEDMELFTLLKVGKQLRGTWKLHEKELSVSLQEVDPASIKHPYAGNPFLTTQELEPFDRLRASFARLIPSDSVTRLNNGIELSWYLEKRSLSELFRVTKGLPPATMDWINDKLEALQVETFIHYTGCGDPAQGFEYTATVNDYFVNHDFLSLELVQSWFCGGAHPDFSSLQVNLDLKNLLELSTEDLVQFPGAVANTNDNFSEWSAYRSEFGTRMNAYLKALYPEYMPPPDVPAEEYEDCNYDDPMVWEFSDVRITSDGFKIGAYFYRAARMCDDPEWAYIPYDVIEEFIHPDYREQLMLLSK